MVEKQLIDIEPEQDHLLKKILKRQIPYKTVWVYGSRVNWTSNQYADLDLVVFDIDSLKLEELKESFAENNFPFSVDVMNWEKIPESFKANIQRNYEVLQEKPKLDNWKECKLGDVAEIVGGGTPKTKVREYWNGEIPWLTPRDLSNFSGRYISSGERSLSQLGLNNSSAKILPKGTVLLSSRAPVGYLGIALNEITTNQGFRSLILNSKSDSLFLFYLLKNNVEYLRSQSTGTTFGELSGSTLKSLSFLFPPLPEQKAIASVLSSLDDKIDLLHRQNKTLEAMAETLFRQWFVEEAQEDWEEVKLDSLINISSGKGLKKEHLSENGAYPVLGANGEIGRTNEFLFDESLLFTGRVGTLGNIFRVENEKVWLSDNTLVIKPKNYFNFVYFVLKTAKLEEYNVGSTQPLIRQSDIKEIEISLPSENKLHEFEKESDLLLKKVQQNKSQIRTLEKLRDTLLPKLMSGEVRVQI